MLGFAALTPADVSMWHKSRASVPQIDGAGAEERSLKKPVFLQFTPLGTKPGLP